MKTILDNHGQVSDKAEPGKPVSAMVDLMDQKQKQIDKSNLELVMNELSFDLESFKVYRQKVVQCMSNRPRKIQDWKGQVVQDAQQAADHYMSLHAACPKIGLVMCHLLVFQVCFMCCLCFISIFYVCVNTPILR